MANFEIPENPKYTEEIRKFDITDSAHAELFNGVIQALINNETFLKKIQEKHADDTEEQFQQQYEQLTGYTDTKIGQLINGAPVTLDTIKEVADAILENETIIEALNEAIGKKLNKDGDISDATVAFTSEDTDESPTLWKDIGRIVSGKLKEILNRVSIMSNNLKYLRKLYGTTDVSKIADGTLTGIVNSLNTDKVAREWKQSTISFMDCTNPPTDMGIEGFLDKKVIPEAFKEVPIGYAFKNIVSSNQGPAYCALVLSHASGMCGGIVFGYDTYKFTQFLYNRNSGYHGIRFL
ncbi:hypothetical protein E5329_23040 [Petralouisia muris]|uniref:Uncharacterized protein n=1 Tax=Petralouisia muris TaxID=3032872 RepID=A0AC61RQL9_9FIRM|nr:hypothetical protein [Petralouisia muris]TGY91070.1 hypothetical protein E5329_23040 [Petralouisia muris]